MYKKLLIGVSGDINSTYFNSTLITSLKCPDLFDVPISNSLTLDRDADEDPLEMSTTDSLDPYDLGVNEYISGYVAKSVLLSLKCDDCFNFILKQEKHDNSLITLKDRYCLLHPQKDIVQLCKICAQLLKKNDSSYFLEKNILQRLVLQATKKFVGLNPNFFKGLCKKLHNPSHRYIKISIIFIFRRGFILLYSTCNE